MYKNYLLIALILFFSCSKNVRTDEKETKVSEENSDKETEVILNKDGKIPTEKLVEIKKSLIPGAGEGLFAKVDILKNTQIGIYVGKKITRDEYSVLYKNKKHHYVFLIKECAKETKTPYIDGDRTHFVSKVNFGPSTIYGIDAYIQNVRFKRYCKEPYVRLFASRDIKKGEELYVSYGDIYEYDFMEKKEVQDFFLKISGIERKPDEKFTFTD